MRRPYGSPPRPYLITIAFFTSPMLGASRRPERFIGSGGGSYLAHVKSYFVICPRYSRPNRDLHLYAETRLVMSYSTLAVFPDRGAPLLYQTVSGVGFGRANLGVRYDFGAR